MTRQTVKTVLWSVAGDAVAWWIVLSAGSGWVSTGNAEKQARVWAGAAVPRFCTHQNGDREHKLEALKKENSWMRMDFVIKQGWATMPNSKKSGSGMARECAGRILATSNS